MSAAALQGLAALSALLSFWGMWADWREPAWFYFWCGLGTLSGLILLYAP